MCNAAETVTKAGYLLSTKKDVPARAGQTEILRKQNSLFMVLYCSKDRSVSGADTRTEQRMFWNNQRKVNKWNGIRTIACNPNT
jgi:hypothetical protein